jgi:arginase
LEVILSVNEELSHLVSQSVQAGHFPLCLGGDHSMALGSVRGAARNRQLGLIWVDAHADFNTSETTPSGNIHGMPLAALAGLGDARLVGQGATIQPANIAVIGARDLDPGERQNLKQAGIAVFSMDQIDREGLYSVFCKAVEVAKRGTQGIYLSFDLDAIDPLFAPGVGTPVQGGLTYREANLACEMVAETGLLVGMDLVEVNPILDDRNKTAAMAVELAVSALGKRVW